MWRPCNRLKNLKNYTISYSFLSVVQVFSWINVVFIYSVIPLNKKIYFNVSISINLKTIYAYSYCMILLLILCVRKDLKIYRWMMIISDARTYLLSLLIDDKYLENENRYSSNNYKTWRTAIFTRSNVKSI